MVLALLGCASGACKGQQKGNGQESWFGMWRKRARILRFPSFSATSSRPQPRRALADVSVDERYKLLGRLDFGAPCTTRTCDLLVRRLMQVPGLVGSSGL